MPVAKKQIDIVIDRINEILWNQSSYLDPESFVAKRLLADTEKCKSAKDNDGVVSAYLARAAVHQICGNETEARADIRNALALQNQPIVSREVAAILGNFGFFSEAQKEYRRISDPTLGLFTKSWPVALSCGAFQTLSSSILSARKMNIEGLERLDTQLIERAATILAKENISDEYVAAILDIAGEILRKNRLFPMGELPRIEIAESTHSSPECVYYSIQVGVPGKVAAGLFAEFASRLSTRLETLPENFHVTFLPLKANASNSAAVA